MSRECKGWVEIAKSEEGVQEVNWKLGDGEYGKVGHDQQGIE